MGFRHDSSDAIDVVFVRLVTLLSQVSHLRQARLSQLRRFEDFPQLLHENIVVTVYAQLNFFEVGLKNTTRERHDTILFRDVAGRKKSFHLKKQLLKFVPKDCQNSKTGQLANERIFQLMVFLIVELICTLMNRNQSLVYLQWLLVTASAISSNSL